MAYCVLDDLKEKISEEELIQLTDDEETGLIVTSRTDRAISDADALIDGYCGRRYSVPLDPVPAIIRKFSVDIMTTSKSSVGFITCRPRRSFMV